MTEQKREPAAPAGETKKVKPEIPMPKNKPRSLILPDDRARVVDPESLRPNTSRIMSAAPRSLMGHVRADATRRDGRPALPIPMQHTAGGRAVQAFTPAAVLSRWEEEAAGIRSLERDDNVITMFEMIGEDYWSGGGVTAKKVASQLKGIGGREVEVQINSPGGSMFEGLAIYNVLREHPYPVTVKVMGMAASAASIITMAGDQILIGAASFLMVHNCWVMGAGNRHDFEELSNWLAPFDAAMSTVYAWRSGGKLTDEAAAKLMDKETYLSGTEAIKVGLADDLLSSDKMTVDSDAKAKDKEHNRLRAMEISLMQSRGLSRSEAQKEIKALRGTTDSGARNDDTADPVVDQNPTDHDAWLSAGAEFLASLKGSTSTNA